MLPGDFAATAGLCTQCGIEPLLQSRDEFERHITTNGTGLCWAAEEDGTLVGIALCGSDGIFGHLLQLVANPIRNGASSDTLRRELAGRCGEACMRQGLRSLRADVQIEQDDGLFTQIGWSASHKVYSRPGGESPQKKSRIAGGETGSAGSADASSQGGAASSAAPKAPTKLSRDGKDVNEYYGAWDKLNVEKAIVAEDGGDPTIVPEQAAPVEMFNEFGRLDISSKLTRYSWDQSDKFVSIYLPLEGVHTLPPESVECHVRSFGVLLIVTMGAKKRWYKVPNLCKEVDVAASKRNIKTDNVVLKLKKLAVGETWSDLNDEKDKYQERREYRINHGDLKGATTEELLADMYKNANDEDRAGLRDAMKVNREKRTEDAKNAKGK